MSSYFAKAGDRLVAVTGSLGSGLLRVVDVDIRGNPIGAPVYMPANVQLIELNRNSNGLLEEINDESQKEIDWEAHETTDDYSEANEGQTTSNVSDLSRQNPAMAAFPELQGE